MTAKTFASSADLGVKEQTLEVLADGVYALTAEGDPNLGAPDLLRGVLSNQPVLPQRHR